MGKTSWKNKETVLIIVAWLLVFVSAPLYHYYVEVAGQVDFSWQRIFREWNYSLAYLVIFLLHHYALVPRLMKKNKTLYVVSAVLCLVLFYLFLSQKAPEFRIPDELPNHRHLNIPPPLLAPPDMARLVTMMLLMLADLGIISILNEQKLREQLLQLEKQNLKQELEHLRYQINPHFFMNTLNNIHALVDIDQDMAKRAIVELSGMMRYALYEGKELTVQLSHEADFLRQYVALMKLRYSEKVTITCELPLNIPSDVTLPPMLLATFAENAFKHGVSYMNRSFISMRLWIGDNREIHFECINSLHELATSTEDGHHGIGLVNVRKRLDLQYADKYSLALGQEGKKFVVRLKLSEGK